MILAAFRRAFYNRNIHALYGMIVAQARLPAFYMDYQVPDTVQGRFELIVLHLVLFLRRFAPETKGKPGRAAADSGPAHKLGQGLFDAFCSDLDDNLREMGVGDLTVPKEMRRFGEAFYGRQRAYVAALDAGDNAELEKALARNIFGIAGVDDRAARLARYARAAAAALDAEAEDALATARPLFPHPEVFVHA